jgi:hypothetical protein
VVVSALWCGVAAAEPFSDFYEVQPDRNVDTAEPTTMPWCPAKAKEQWPQDRLHRAVGSREAYDNWAEAAAQMCPHKADPTWVKQATYLVQAWMNARDLSQDAAEKEIAEKLGSKYTPTKRAPHPVSPEDEKRFAFAESELTVTKPDPGVDEAKVTGKPAWCDAAKLTERWDTGRIERSVNEQYGIKGTIEGALHVCQRTDPTWIKEAGYILQKWMNYTHLSQAEAEKSLRARIQTDKWEAERDALCKALEPDPEAAGPDKDFPTAKRSLFGCGDAQVMWIERHKTYDPDIGFYLDLQAKPESELLRIYWLYRFTDSPFEKELPAKNADDNRRLLYYAVAQDDAAHIDTAALTKELSAAPYNEYARIVAMELVGRLAAERKVYEAALDKMGKDEDYKAILRDAPAKARADWDKEASRWKTELDHSNAFEALLSKPSRKALKGCSAQLQKDAEKVIKSLGGTDYQDMANKIASDPVATIIASRLAICDAIDGQFGISGVLKDMTQHARQLRGPRSAAYYAVVDAVAYAAKDRPRMLLSLMNFFYSSPELFQMAQDWDFGGFMMPSGENDTIKGVIKSLNKKSDGFELVFKKESFSYPGFECRDTSRPMKIEADGTIRYYQICHNTGKTVTVDRTPEPIMLVPAAASGLKPGMFVVASSYSKRSADGGFFGVVHYAKKSVKDKTIVSFLGFPL